MFAAKPGGFAQAEQLLQSRRGKRRGPDLLCGKCECIEWSSGRAEVSPGDMQVDRHLFEITMGEQHLVSLIREGRNVGRRPYRQFVQLDLPLK